MRITMDLPKPKKVRADSLKIGDSCVDGGTVFRIIDSNSSCLYVATRTGSYLPKVLVDNLSTATLGWLKKDLMVTPVNLELIVTESQKN